MTSMGTLARYFYTASLALALIVLPLGALADDTNRFELFEETVESARQISTAEIKEEATAITTAAIKSKSKYRSIYDKELKRKRLIKDGLVLKFKTGTTESEIAGFLKFNSLKLVSKIDKHSYLVKVVDEFEDVVDSEQLLGVINNVHNFAAGKRVLAVANQPVIDILESADLNEYKQLSTHLVKTADTKKQWHLDNNGINGLKAGADINALDAWRTSKGFGTKVAVIDTGFDVKNPDINFADDSFNALSVDEDGNVSDPNEEYDASAPSYSRENHATAVAGIIAAKDNGKGVVGVAPEAKIIPIRLINDYGMVSSAQIIAAHRKADELGAKIINNSWGSYDPSLGENEVLDITAAEREMYEDVAKNGNNGKGILIIFASGNSGDKNFNNAPEARQDYVLAVGATDSTDQRSSYSLYGSELDLVAPGGGAQSIITTDRRDVMRNVGGKLRLKIKGYAKGNIATDFHGTSAAAPVVAGVAALVWAVNPKLSADEVREIIQDTANKNINAKYSFDASGKNSELGYGRVDAAAAVEAALATLD